MRKLKVLFFSRGDSTRSQMAEGFLHALAGDEIIAVSSAVEAPKLDPLAVDVMQEVGVDISSQHAKEIRESFKEHFACVVTVCDASKERFPVWPFTQNLLHWSLRDPASVPGPLEEHKSALREVRDEIGRRVDELIKVTLPRLHVHA